MSGIQPLPLLHVSLKPVLGLAAPICVGSSEILWHFGIIIVEWAHVWGWKESGLREPQCRFWRTEWRSQRSSGCLSSPFFPRQQCPPSNTGAMPAASLCEGRRHMLQEWSFPVSPGTKKWWSGAFLLLLAVCHAGQEAMLKASSAFLGFSTTLEGLS